MIHHPCRGLSPSAKRAFELIAINEQPRRASKTLDILLKNGLIAKGQPAVFRDRLGSYEVPTYYVPLHIHMKWCEWCAEQPDNDDA